MQKIGSSTNTADANGEFTEGDPQTQIPCTWVTAAWLNTLQRELVHLCEEAGIAIDPHDDTQIYQAIQELLKVKFDGLGTAAFADIVTSMTDTTAGRVPVAGWMGPGGTTVRLLNDILESNTGFPSALFSQGGGANDTRFGSYGCGVHLLYGETGDGTAILTANLFVDSKGNLSVEWLAISKADGSVVAQKMQKLFGPLNKPTADDCNAVSAGGGNYNAIFAFGGVGTIGQESNASELFSRQGNDGTIVSGVRHHWYNDVIEAGIVRGNSYPATGYVIALNGNKLLFLDTHGAMIASGNTICLQGDDRKHFSIRNTDGTTRAYIWKDKGDTGLHVSNGDDGGSAFTFGKDNNFYSPGQVVPGNYTNFDSRYLTKSENLPVGIPLPWPTATPPSGWLICNGSAFNKTSCPKLASVYPSGNLPDLRAQFIRGLDNGKNIDTGRAILSTQAGQSPYSSVGSTYGNTSWNNRATVKTGYYMTTGTDNDGTYQIMSESQAQRETRPTNVAFNYIVRAA